MNELCQGCEPGTVCVRHRVKKNSRQVEFCKGVANTPDRGKGYWNKWERGESGATAPGDPQINTTGFSDGPVIEKPARNRNQKPRPTISQIGNRMQAIIERENDTVVTCGDCKNHIRQLNNMTVAEVKEKRDETISEIADRAKRKSPHLWQRIAVVVDQALHIGETERRIGKWLDEAIAAEEQYVSSQAKRHNKPRLQPKSTITGPLTEFVTFTEPVRRNLLYHIYPMKKHSGVWQWNLDQLIRRIDLFNGKRIVGIVHDSHSADPDEVKKYLRGHVDNFVVLNNVKQRGEGITFLPMMEQIESFDANEVTFRAHAKSVSKRETELPYIQKWTEIMYAVCLDDWQIVRSQLEESGITGPFRRRKKMGNAAWFYSGSFYWFRNRDVFERNWRNIHPQRVGIETWPFQMFRMEESGCLFDDGAGSLYEERYMVGRAWPKYQEWITDHVPNRVIAMGRSQSPRWMEQHNETSLSSLYSLVSTTPSDICEHCTTLKELASRCETVTEFGTRYGVSTIAMLAGKPATMTSYDIERSSTVATIENAVENTAYRFVKGDTLQVEIEPTDLLLIDTLHTYRQLKSELNRHASKVGRYIVLHDTVTFGERGENGGKGLRLAVGEFLSENPEWSVRADFKNNNGLMVLGK